MKQKLFILIILLLIFGTALFLWWNQAIKAPNPLDDKTVSFSIQKGENARSIALRLEQQKVIRSALAFFIQARFGGLSDKIQAGDFLLNPGMNMTEVADTLTHGTMDIRITIPEGFRNEQIAMIIAKEFSIPEATFLQSAKEGYMFPDTYFLPKDATTKEIADLFLINFNKKIASLDQNKMKSHNLTLDKLLIIASMVEREAKHAQDRPLIASVILNRLSIGMKLDIDATVQYALGFQTAEKSWWKTNLTLEDLAIDSPYNTYRNQGLPPTPIANPGLDVISAVLDAPDTDYLYYIADKNGK